MKNFLTTSINTKQNKDRINEKEKKNMIEQKIT